MTFNTNVFINCPFDKDYDPILKALVFTLLYFELEPKISTTKSSGHIRVNEIMNLIQESKYSIHDISRCEPLKMGELPRFNMPYEMGIDIGCSRFGNTRMRSKECLILEAQKNRYDIMISDISGQDIKEHNNKPKKVIEKLLEWFAANGAVPANRIIGLTAMWSKYLDCKAKVGVNLLNEGHTKKEIKNISIPQYIIAMKLALS